MTKALIPLLSRGEYAPLRDSLVASCQEVIEGRLSNFSLTFRNKLGRPNSLFVQGFKLNDSTLQLEVNRGEDIHAPAQLGVNDLYMRATGWTIPLASVAGYPNYIRKVALLGVDLYATANRLIDSSIAIGYISPASWLEFGPKILSKQIAASRTLWHHELDEDLLCLPGQNLATCREAS